MSGGYEIETQIWPDLSLQSIWSTAIASSHGFPGVHYLSCCTDRKEKRRKWIPHITLGLCTDYSLNVRTFEDDIQQFCRNNPI